MVKVIKLDKREENFNEEKLKQSIVKAMESADISNKLLVESVMSQIESFIKDKDYVLTKDLRNEVIKILATEESSEVAKAYMMFVKESQSQTINKRVSKIYYPESSDCGT